MNVSLVGSGNVATHLGRALVKAGHNVLGIYSRTEASASRLAAELAAKVCSSPDELPESEMYVISVSDDAIPETIKRLCTLQTDAIFVHTAGSVPMSVFEGFERHYGVVYPLQTLSKQRPVDFSRVPLFVEASDDATRFRLLEICDGLSCNVVEMDSETRRKMHLSAVFACNFVNHLYALGERMLEENGLPFELLLPLIDETAAKVHHLSPRRAQTGPAVRGDKKVMERQEQLLEDVTLRKLYRLMSESIENLSNHD